ncbi:winged helix DNA-binding protein, partial [Escherichia coli]
GKPPEWWEKQKGSRGIRRGQWYRLVFQFPIRELEKRGWIERRESDNDRRCLHLQLTEKGHEFLREVLPPQHNCLHQLWSALSTTEKDQLEQITRKLLSRLDQMEQDGVVLEAMS